MAPNSEEDSKIAFSNGRNWGIESEDKEPLRPPVYNPEDYATSLKKWGKKGSMGVQIPRYLSQSTGSLEKFSDELNQRNKRQSSPSTKSASSIKSGEEKQTKKEKESTLKTENKHLKSKESICRGLKNDLQKDFLSPILSLSAQTEEMSLRQFSSVTELLGKLKVDLKLSFPSFVQEFVGDPIDGVTLLLELLRAVQLSQTSQLQRCPPQILRRALLDEHSCLVCLKHCLRCADASRRLASSPAGLFTLAVCIMSNVTQSRIIALELLTKACEPQAGGHKAVSEALSTLRLRFGEPVRFRFLVGMLSSAGAIELLAAAMKFINVFVDSAPGLQQKVYIQAELEQAGFDSEILRKTLPTNSESVKVELNKWEKNYFNVEKLHNKVGEVNVLQEKIHLLEKRIKILQEEKGILQSLEQCLKERCSELEEEVSTKTPNSKIHPVKPFRNTSVHQSRKNIEKGESTPAEDEGISSSEQELSQDEDYVKGEIHYKSSEFEQITSTKKNKPAREPICEPNRFFNKTTENVMKSNCNFKNLKNIRSNKMKETNVDDGNEIIPLHREDDEEEEEEEETTIDEVIEELENIVNDAETEAYDNEEKLKILTVKSSMPFTECSKEYSPEEKCQTYTKKNTFQEKHSFEESEIVPAILHPQPPKKAKSLIHIYFPGNDFDSQGRNKSEFFEDDSDAESSDSLLTAAREKNTLKKGSHKSLEVSDSFNSFSSVNTRSLFIKQERDFEDTDVNSTKLRFEERNIDEEEIKRKHLKNLLTKRGIIQGGFSEIPHKNKKTQKTEIEEIKKDFNEKLNGFKSNCERKSFQNSFTDRISDESPLSRIPKVAPTPVKRSQTFHITSSEGENFNKKMDIKPKPKMGVSGLDFQRTSEQKIKNEQWKTQVTEYKKNLEKRMDTNDRYTKKVFPKHQNNEKNVDTPLRRGSFSESFNAFKPCQSNNFTEYCNDSFFPFDKVSTTIRSKNVEKIEEGLDSFVDIVISTDETKKSKPKTEHTSEVTKNIGPRTRRSLVESSLFCPQYAKNLNKPQGPAKPPKPAQRTSLARNNSSSTPLYLPTEIQLSPNQINSPQKIIYNFGMKPAKSADSLLPSSQTKRCPPDGSSSPNGFGINQENQKCTADHSQIHSRFEKPTKIQTFFGNPKFENASGFHVNHKYFESNYAAVTNEKLTSAISNLQPIHNYQEKFKGQVLNSQQQKSNSDNKPFGIKDVQGNSKPNFLLGTYQSPSTKNNDSKPKINGLVLQSINAFNNSFANKNIALNSIYSGSKKNKSEFSSSAKETNPEITKNNSNASGTEKVTDSPSGLY